MVLQSLVGKIDPAPGSSKAHHSPAKALRSTTKRLWSFASGFGELQRAIGEPQRASWHDNTSSRWDKAALWCCDGAPKRLELPSGAEGFDSYGGLEREKIWRVIPDQHFRPMCV
jgi:hypothetical protein